MTSEEDKYFVSLGMITYGGSFVHKLGHALSSADFMNTSKIKLAFPEYWNKYLEMGKSQHKKEGTKNE